VRLEEVMTDPVATKSAKERLRGKGEILGTADLVAMDDLDGRLVLTFASGNRTDVPDPSVALTQFPEKLIIALIVALNSPAEVVSEFRGENFRGRAGFHPVSLREGRTKEAYSWVVEFEEPETVSFLIHLTKEQMRELMLQMVQLPLPMHPTD
jgi:hypothetical protein